MKKMLSLLLCLTLLSGLSGAALAETGASAALAAQLSGFKVSLTTQMSGHFFSDMWGNNTADMDVRALIHGYSTVAWNTDGDYQIDPTVIKDTQVSDDKAGNRTYRFTLNDGLKYSDGTPITAKDYAFSALLLSDPRMTQLGSVSSGALSQLVGFDAYEQAVNKQLEAQTPAGTDPEQPIAPIPFSGIRLISDTEFSLSIDHSRLPYFYELALVSVQPYPMRLIAPGCDIADDGQGAYIDGPFSAALLKRTVLDPQTGYLYHPNVSCGPYTLSSFDPENSLAQLTRNDEYKGNFEGRIPAIEQLVFFCADQETMLDDLREGRIDLINKVSSGERIAQGLQMESAQQIAGSSYLRNGLSFLSFACEQGYTQSVNMRKAIAMCVDVDALANQFLQGYGIPCYGYYGYGQWMAAESHNDLLSLSMLALNLNAARALLEEDGWTLAADGSPYDDELGGIRHRMGEGAVLEPLTIKWAKPAGTDAAKLLGEMLSANLSQVGIDLKQTELPFSELLKHYYRQTERTYDMFFMATNFSLVFDPYDTFSSEDNRQGIFNTTGIRDPLLMDLAKDMRETDPQDREGYLKKWMKFQQHWVEVLPMAPLYSNIYYDFYRTDLQNYVPSANWSFETSILYAYVGEPADAQSAKDQDAPADESGEEGIIAE